MNVERKLGVWMCTALVVGNMIGSGIFMLPAALAPYGMNSVLAWLATSAGARAGGYSRRCSAACRAGRRR